MAQDDERLFNIPLVSLEEFLLSKAYTINEDNIEYLCPSKTVLNSIASPDWILNRKSFNNMLSYIAYMKNEKITLNPNTLKVLQGFVKYMEKTSQRIKNANLNPSIVEIIRRSLIFASWILLLLSKKFKTIEKSEKQFLNDFTQIFHQTMTHSLSILINIVDIDPKWNMKENYEFVEVIEYQNNFLLDIFSNYEELKQSCYVISQYIQSTASVEIFRNATQRFMDAIISLSFHHIYINGIITEVLNRLSQNCKNAGYLLFGAAIFFRSKQYIESNDSKSSSQLIKLIHESDLSIEDPSKRLCLIFLNYLLNFIIKGDTSFFRSIFGYILTHIKYAYQNSFLLSNRVIQFILKAVQVKDVTIKIKCLECLEALIAERNTSELECREKIFDIIVENLTKYSTKVRLSSSKILYSLVCKLNSENWFLSHFKRVKIENVLLNIAFLSTTSPYYNIHIFEITKKIIYELLKYDIVDLKNFINMILTKPIESHISDMLVEVLNAYLLIHDKKFDCTLFWCDIIGELNRIQLNILCPILCKIDHPSLDLFKFISLIQEDSDHIIQALKVCYCLYSNQKFNSHNELRVLVELIHQNLQNLEILEYVLDILLKIDPSYIKSFSLIEVFDKMDVLNHLFLTDATRNKFLRLLYSSIHRPRRIVFSLVENILFNLEKYGILKFLRILKDVAVENCEHLKMKVNDFLKDNKENSSIKESITKIQDNDIISGYISRFINMIIWGITSIELTTYQRMNFLFCLGTLLSYSPTLSMQYSDLIISDLSNDNLEPDVYSSCLIIGTDILRIIPNQVKKIKDYLFDCLIVDNKSEEKEYIKFISLTLIEQLYKERLINIDYKIYNIALMLRNESEIYDLKDISIRILENYIKRSSSKFSAIRLAFNLCMSILTSYHIEEEKLIIIKVILSSVINTNLQKELSTYLIKGIISGLSKGRVDNMLRHKLYLLSVCKKSKTSTSLVENTLKNINGNCDYIVDENIVKMLKLHIK